MNRYRFICVLLSGVLLYLLTGSLGFAQVPLPGGTLDPTTVPKYVMPLLIPSVMPMAGTIKARGGKNIDYYEISVKQFEQQILPAGLPCDYGVGIWSCHLRKQERFEDTQCTLAHDRGQVAEAGSGEMGQ